MRKIKWGILGPGIIARQFAADFKSVTNAELVAVGSTSIERAELFAREFNIPDSYGSYEALLANPAIDAVYISTPHNFHYQMAVDALTAGKHVLCEKPVTISIDELLKLIKLANSKGLYFMEGMWTYFLPAIIKAKMWVDQGRIGNVINVTSSFGFVKPFDPQHRLYNPDLAGGTIFDLGIYNVAITWLFLKKDPVYISAIAQKAPTNVESDALVHFAYENNKASAVLHSSFLSQLNNHAFIYGDKGYIALPDFWRAKSCILYENSKVTEHFDDNRVSIGFEFEITDFSNDLLDRKIESTTVPHAYSIKFQEHMAEILQVIKE